MLGDHKKQKDPLQKKVKKQQGKALEPSYLTRCLKGPAYVAIWKIKKIYFPLVASNYNLKEIAEFTT